MKAFKPIILLCCALIMFGTCTKDDDPEPKLIEGGKLVLEEANYELVHGEILRFDKLDDGVYYCPIYMLSSSFDLTDTEVGGTGQMVELTLIFESPNYINPGIYNCYDEENKQLNSFIISVYKNFQMDTWEVESHYQGVGGTIEVTRSGNYYILDIDILADKYDVQLWDYEPESIPVGKSVRITGNYTGEFIQKYFE